MLTVIGADLLAYLCAHGTVGGENVAAVCRVEHIHIGMIVAVNAVDNGGVAMVDVYPHFTPVCEIVVYRVLVEAVEGMLV